MWTMWSFPSLYETLPDWPLITALVGSAYSGPFDVDRKFYLMLPHGTFFSLFACSSLPLVRRKSTPLYRFLFEREEYRHIPTVNCRNPVQTLGLKWLRRLSYCVVWIRATHEVSVPGTKPLEVPSWNFYPGITDRDRHVPYGYDLHLGGGCENWNSRSVRLIILEGDEIG